jgi:DNA-binding HxlR family transcriptional regulator
MERTKPATPAIDPDRADHCRVVGAVLDRIGDKWTIMVVSVLTDGPARFTTIMREIGGITHRMLTLTLRGLERDGLVKRTAYATVPPRVEYELTEMGRTLTTTLIPLAQWSEANWQSIRLAQQRHDAQSMPALSG